MMTRVQILLPEDQDNRLEALAAKRRESKGKLIRRALDLLLRTESSEEEPLLSLIGQAGRSRRLDISDRHDQIAATMPAGDSWRRSSRRSALSACRGAPSPSSSDTATMISASWTPPASRLCGPSASATHLRSTRTSLPPDLCGCRRDTGIGQLGVMPLGVEAGVIQSKVAGRLQLP
jgi:hypothetical protein